MSMRFYIDSRFRESGTASDFRWNVAPVELHDGAMGYIDSFCCSNVFNSVIAGHNDAIYFRQTDGLNFFDKKLLIPPGQYTAPSLAAAVQLLLNEYALKDCLYAVAAVAGTQLAFGSHTLGVVARIFTTTEVEGNLPDWGVSNDNFQIDDFQSGHVLGEVGLTTAGQLDRRDAADAGELLGLTDGKGVFPLTGHFVNLLPYRTLYLTSGSVGSANAYSPKGELSQIVKKISIADSLPGQAILDRLNVTLEPFHMPPSLSSLHFSLRDRKGKGVDCKGHSISFTLVIPERGIL